MGVQCSECGNPQKARGLCQKHYDNKRRSGQIETVRRTRRDPTVRDANGNKLCIKCSVWYPESNFARNALRKDGLAAYCKLCVRVNWDESYRVVRFGLSKGSIERILIAQNYKCAICSAGVDRSSPVDHDHKCCPGRSACGACVRGIICRTCNSYLGYVNDSVDVFESAIRYLKGESVGSHLMS